jgi:hypothetical protein
VTTRAIIMDQAAIANMLYGQTGDVNRAMRRFADLAEQTTRQVADERVTRRTGAYHSSISAEVVSKDRVEVRADAPHAIIIELGSRPHRIGSAVLIADVGWRYITDHPGTQGQHVLADGVDRAMDRLDSISYDG